MFRRWQVGGAGAEPISAEPMREQELNPVREIDNKSDGISVPSRRARARKRQRGSAMVEVALMAPWIFFLFVGIFDFGFYAVSLICVQNAAREAALRTATFSIQSPTEACQAAIDQIKWLPNARSLTSTCSAPLTVTLRTLCTQATVVPKTITCTAPGCADCGADPTAASTEVTVAYQTIPLIPIPGVLTNQMTMVRKAEMRIVP